MQLQKQLFRKLVIDTRNEEGYYKHEIIEKDTVILLIKDLGWMIYFFHI
jgi:hypothetical protein